MNKEDPLQMLQGEKRDKKDGRGRKQRPHDKRLQGERGKQKKGLKRWEECLCARKQNKSLDASIVTTMWVGRVGSQRENST